MRMVKLAIDVAKVHLPAEEEECAEENLRIVCVSREQVIGQPHGLLLGGLEEHARRRVGDRRGRSRP